MEVLLLQDIQGIGKINDLVVVGDGFAMNALLPKQRALVATPAVRKRYAEQIKKRAEERAVEQASQREQAAALANKEITIEHKVTEKGKLYAAVSEAEIAAALKQQHTISVDEKMIAIHDPMKEVGTHEVKIRFDVASETLKVHIVAEGEVESKTKKDGEEKMEDIEV